VGAKRVYFSDGCVMLLDYSCLKSESMIDFVNKFRFSRGSAFIELFVNQYGSLVPIQLLLVVLIAGVLSAACAQAQGDKQLKTIYGRKATQAQIDGEAAAIAWRQRTPHEGRAITEADWLEYARPIPQWYQDAKFGIYAHWGPYNLGMETAGFSGVNNSWYPKYIFAKGHPYNVQHEKILGSINEFGYEDYFPLFTIPKFDPAEWADLVAGSGAKFAGPVAMHHDGFAMWESQVVPFHSMNSGAKRDIAGELIVEYRKRGLKIVSSFHHAFNVTGHYYGGREKRPDDGPVQVDSSLSDPAYAKLYGKFETQKEAEDYWLAVLKEYITKYKPDQIWFDGGLKRLSSEALYEMTSFYYDFCEENGIEGIISRKHEQLPLETSLFDIERGGANEILARTWQTDDSPGPWMFIEGAKFKGADWVTRLLVDIISKNGVLLLNIAPLADGSIHSQQQETLKEVGAWLKINGEAVYGSRPWRVHHQGDQPFFYGGGKAFSKRYSKFDENDLRFTQSKDGKTLYIFAMGSLPDTIAIDSLKVEELSNDATVSMVGSRNKQLIKADAEGRALIPMTALAVDQNTVPGSPIVFKITGFK